MTAEAGLLLRQLTTMQLNCLALEIERGRARELQEAALKELEVRLGKEE